MRGRPAFAGVEVHAERHVAEVGEAVGDVADVLVEAAGLVDHDQTRSRAVRSGGAREVAVDLCPLGAREGELFGGDARRVGDRARDAVGAGGDWRSGTSLLALLCSRSQAGTCSAGSARSPRSLRRTRLRVSQSSSLSLASSAARRSTSSSWRSMWPSASPSSSRRRSGSHVVAAQLRAHLGAGLLGGEQRLELLEGDPEEALQAHHLAQALDLVVACRRGAGRRVARGPRGAGRSPRSSGSCAAWCPRGGRRRRSAGGALMVALQPPPADPRSPARRHPPGHSGGGGAAGRRRRPPRRSRRAPTGRRACWR